ncbi:UNVERIFIED_ORG: hypothetical protein J2R93_004861 [Bradyrhizobium japonicum]
MRLSSAVPLVALAHALLEDHVGVRMLTKGGKA